MSDAQKTFEEKSADSNRLFLIEYDVSISQHATHEIKVLNGPAILIQLNQVIISSFVIDSFLCNWYATRHVTSLKRKWLTISK